MCLISKIQCDETTGIRIAVPARRRGVPWGTRKQARGGDFEAPSGILILLSFAVSQTTPMASLHATQVWFVGMNIPKNSIPDFISTARAAVPARAVEMKNRDFSKKNARAGIRTTNHGSGTVFGPSRPQLEHRPSL